MVEMGQRIRWVRDIYGKSQAQMAEEVGIDQTAWSLYERGQRWPDIAQAARIVAKLKVSHAYLLDGSLEGVERDLAIRLAAYHPQLVLPRRTDLHRDRLQA
jgi:transcriptional regulator with XRE-family HTH domain